MALSNVELFDLKTYLDGLGNLHSAQGPMGAISYEYPEIRSTSSGAAASVFRVRECTFSDGRVQKTAEVIAPNMYRREDAEFLVKMPEVMRELIAEVEASRAEAR